MPRKTFIKIADVEREVRKTLLSKGPKAAMECLEAWIVRGLPIAATITIIQHLDLNIYF